MKIRNNISNSPNGRVFGKNVTKNAEGNSGEEARATKLWLMRQL